MDDNSPEFNAPDFDGPTLMPDELPAKDAFEIACDRYCYTLLALAVILIGWYVLRSDFPFARFLRGEL